MSSLYRRYRPQVFTEVLGQDHISSTLVSSLQKNNLGHAYLFAGPRGTGKTTLARLFARAINCQQRTKTQDPCNSCELCLEIGDGKAVDVLEIDAASNRGIDEIRELRERINFAPTRAQFKVYIIDEVHMLTKEAFNALLKTLEEPPSHAVFILATTELHKVPETIISRCQRFNFHRASTEALTQLLSEVAKKEKIAIDQDGLAALAVRAEGSYRDSLTLLGNLATYEGELSGSMVRELLGLPASEIVEGSLTALREGNVESLAALLKEFIAKGGDVVVLVKAIADVCKEQILSKPEELQVSTTQIMESLLAGLARSRTSTDPTALLLAQLVNLTSRFTKTPARVAPPPAMTDVAKVEKTKVEDTTPVDAVAAAPKASAITPPADSGAFWDRFLEGIKEHNHALYMIIRSAQLADLTDATLVLAVKFRFYVDRLNEARNKKIIETVTTGIVGHPLKLECLIRPEIEVAAPKDDEVVNTVVDVFELEEVK